MSKCVSVLWFVLPASHKKLDEFKTMFLESEIRDLQKLLKEERTQNEALNHKLHLTERQLAVERLYVRLVITSPPNGPVLYCWLASVVFVVCNTVGRRAGWPPGAWERGVGTLLAVRPAGCRACGRSGGRHCTAGQSCYVR